MPPHQWPELFNSQYDCLMFGYEESKKKMKEIGRKEVNKYNIYIKFNCDAVEDTEKTPTSFDKLV